LLFQFAFQAPGPLANVGSKEAALDFDFHVKGLMDLDATQEVRSRPPRFQL
jgi:hypothetical protein